MMCVLHESCIWKVIAFQSAVRSISPLRENENNHTEIPTVRLMFQPRNRRLKYLGAAAATTKKTKNKQKPTTTATTKQQRRFCPTQDKKETSKIKQPTRS